MTPSGSLGATSIDVVRVGEATLIAKAAVILPVQPAVLLLAQMSGVLRVAMTV